MPFERPDGNPAPFFARLPTVCQATAKKIANVVHSTPLARMGLPFSDQTILHPSILDIPHDWAHQNEYDQYQTRDFVWVHYHKAGRTASILVIRALGTEMCVFRRARTRDF